MLKDVVSIPGISMTYVLNKTLKTKKLDEPDLYPLGQPCIHTCENCLSIWKKCKWVKTNCMKCVKNKPYELLRICMVGGPIIVFCQYAEAGKSQIRDNQYHCTKTCASIIGFNANSLYLYCSDQEMSCGKEQYVKVKCPEDLEVVWKLCNQVTKGTSLRFLQVDDIHVPGDSKERFSEFCPFQEK